MTEANRARAASFWRTRAPSPIRDRTLRLPSRRAVRTCGFASHRAFVLMRSLAKRSCRSTSPSCRTTSSRWFHWTPPVGERQSGPSGSPLATAGRRLAAGANVRLSFGCLGRPQTSVARLEILARRFEYDEIHPASTFGEGSPNAVVRIRMDVSAVPVFWTVGQLTTVRHCGGRATSFRPTCPTSMNCHLTAEHLTWKSPLCRWGFRAVLIGGLAGRRVISMPSWTRCQSISLVVAAPSGSRPRNAPPLYGRRRSARPAYCHARRSRTSEASHGAAVP
jgi:hypothetical protein